MTAAAQDRDTREMTGRTRGLPMEAGAKGFGGTLACVNAAANVVKGSLSAALKCVGVFQQTYDNTTGAAGAVMAEVKTGVYGPFANSASADLVTNADCGNDCFIVDDSTVAKTSASAARSVAGKVWFVDAGGVWIKFS